MSEPISLVLLDPLFHNSAAMDKSRVILVEDERYVTDFRFYKKNLARVREYDLEGHLISGWEMVQKENIKIPVKTRIEVTP